MTTTPKPIKVLREIVANPDTIVTRGSTYDNRENLAPSFFTQIVRRYEGTRLGRQELNAEILDDVQGALWTRDLIETTRRDKGAVPAMKRIVVAIDPAVSVGEDSDNTGIIVAGLGVDDHGYVLGDDSGKYLPIEWARRAVALYRQHGADRMVAEANQGGDMVEATIRMVDQNASFKAVHASRGKITRAEPIAALAEQNRIHLAGSYPELEDELCTFAAGSPDSPDRMDAMVWAFTELMVDRGEPAILEWARDELDRMKRGLDFFSQRDRKNEPATIKMLAPPGVSTLSTRDGKVMGVPDDRIVAVSEADAKALELSGRWARAG